MGTVRLTIIHFHETKSNFKTAQKSTLQSETRREGRSINPSEEHCLQSQTLRELHLGSNLRRAFLQWDFPQVPSTFSNSSFGNPHRQPGHPCGCFLSNKPGDFPKIHDCNVPRAMTAKVKSRVIYKRHSPRAGPADYEPFVDQWSRTNLDPKCTFVFCFGGWICCFGN